MAVVNGIKTEDGAYIKSEPYIKPDPDLSSPAALVDDEYEDAGDLEITANPPRFVLSRVPAYLFENWSQVEDDEDVRIGTVRVFRNPADPADTRTRIYLDPVIPAHELVPKEYDLKTTKANPLNTFVFSEKDLPGYNPRLRSRIRKPQRVGTDTPGDGARVEKPAWRKDFFRKAIPKQTALTGAPEQETNCVAVESDDYWAILERRKEEQKRKEKTITFIEGDPRKYPKPATGDFVNFIKNPNTLTTKRKESQVNKAVRIPPNELRDQLFNLFKEFKYYPMSTLRARTKQPESYLKEHLATIATLVRAGRFANCWTLKEEFAEDTYKDAVVKAEVAPEEGDGEDYEFREGDAEDDDELKMEDAT